MVKLENGSRDLAGMGMGRRNYEASHNRDENINFHSTLHSHEFYEVYINVSGAKNYILDDQTLPLTGNDLVLVCPFQIHGHLSAEPLFNYERMFLYISREVLEELSHNILPINHILEKAGQENRHYYHITDEQVQQLASWIDAIKENCTHETPYTRLQDTALLTQIMLLVLECIQSRPAAPVPQLKKPQLIQQVLNYINERFDQKLTLDDIANHFFISKSHLSHLFTQYTARSVYEYIIFCRINRARQLISAGTPLTSISYQCGFSDYSNFLRSFSRTVGCSPSDYKKRLQSGAGLAPFGHADDTAASEQAEEPPKLA